MAHLYQYVYLLQEWGFVELGYPIYKIGKTKQFGTTRIRQYHKGSKLELQESCLDCDYVETQIKRIFKDTFKHETNHGTEYFSGDVRKMKRIIFNICEKSDKQIMDARQELVTYNNKNELETKHEQMMCNDINVKEEELLKLKEEYKILKELEEEMIQKEEGYEMLTKLKGEIKKHQQESQRGATVEEEAILKELKEEMRKKEEEYKILKELKEEIRKDRKKRKDKMDAERQIIFYKERRQELKQIEFEKKKQRFIEREEKRKQIDLETQERKRIRDICDQRILELKTKHTLLIEQIVQLKLNKQTSINEIIHKYPKNALDVF